MASHVKCVLCWFFSQLSLPFHQALTIYKWVPIFQIEFGRVDANPCKTWCKLVFRFRLFLNLINLKMQNLVLQCSTLTLGSHVLTTVKLSVICWNGNKLISLSICHWKVPSLILARIWHTAHFPHLLISDSTRIPPHLPDECLMVRGEAPQAYKSKQTRLKHKNKRRKQWKLPCWLFWHLPLQALWWLKSFQNSWE